MLKNQRNRLFFSFEDASFLTCIFLYAFWLLAVLKAE